MTFGYLYDFRNPEQWRRPWTDLYAETLDFITWTESVGFEGAWVPEHHGAADGYAPSPLVVLAAIAARTKTIKLGSAIALAPLYHPVRFAEECAVLDILSNGRLEMAVAVGYRRREAEAYGVDFSTRGRRMDEFLDIVRKLWAGETLSCQGKHFAPQKCLGEVDDAHAGKRTCALRLRHFNGPSTAGVVSRRTLSGLPAHRRFDRHVPT